MSYAWSAMSYSAKSTGVRVLRHLVDPNSTALRSLPRDERDLVIAARNGWLERDRAVLESLTAIKRAGADLIITYYAEILAKLLPN